MTPIAVSPAARRRPFLALRTNMPGHHPWRRWVAAALTAVATGTLASAGTLAVLVPPSTLLVIYGVWTETSIAALFMAGILPCLLLTVVYCTVLQDLACVRWHPSDGAGGHAHRRTPDHAAP